MPTSIDNDTLEAVKTLWVQDGRFDGLFPRPPETGRLKSPQALPNVQLECKKGEKPNERMTGTGSGGVFHDFREVTITIRGVKETVVKALQLALGLFNLNLGTTNNPTLNLPSGARFIQWWPQGDGELVEDEAPKEGKDIWKGIVKGQVWSVRTD